MDIILMIIDANIGQKNKYEIAWLRLICMGALLA